MASKPLILNKQGVTRVVLNLMHEDIVPEKAAKLYKFASPDLKDSFIEGLRLGQSFIQSLRQFVGVDHEPTH